MLILLYQLINTLYTGGKTLCRICFETIFTQNVLENT